MDADETRQDDLLNTKVARGPGGRWVKGQSPNPNGRKPKGASLASFTDKWLDKKEPGEKYTRWEKLLQKIYQQAMAGDAAQQRYLVDRRLGKPDVIQRIFNNDIPQLVITGDEEHPVEGFQAP